MTGYLEFHHDLGQHVKMSTGSNREFINMNIQLREDNTLSVHQLFDGS